MKTIVSSYDLEIFNVYTYKNVIQAYTNLRLPLSISYNYTVANTLNMLQLVYIINRNRHTIIFRYV